MKVGLSQSVHELTKAILTNRCGGAQLPIGVKPPHLSFPLLKKQGRKYNEKDTGVKIRTFTNCCNRQN